MSQRFLHLQRHPQRPLQAPWLWLQIALLILPFSPLLAGVGVLSAAIATWKQRAKSICQRPINCGLAILSVLLVISAVLASDRAAAFLGLANFLPLFFAFTAFQALIQTPAQLRQLAWLLALGSLPVAIVGLGQEFWGWAGHIKILWIVVDLVIDADGNPPGRMASVFAYANVFASYLTLIFPLVLGVWVDAWPKRQSPEPRSWQRWGLLSAIVLLNAIAIVFTDSRNAWGLAALSSLAYALYLGWRWLVVAVGLMVACILGSAYAPPPWQIWLRQLVPSFFWARLTDALYPNRPLATLRVTQWQFAGALAQQRPLTGWGLRNFTPLYQAQWQVFMGHPHSLPLMLLAETGVPATLLLYSLVGWVVVRGCRLWQAWQTPEQERDRLILFGYLTAFLACSLFSLFDVTLFDIRLNILGWLLLAAIAGLTDSQPVVEKNIEND